MLIQYKILKLKIRYFMCFSSNLYINQIYYWKKIYCFCDKNCIIFKYYRVRMFFNLFSKIQEWQHQGQGWDMWQTIRFCFILKRLVQLLFFSYKTTNSTQYLGQHVIGYWFLSNSLQDLLAQFVPTNEQLEQDYTNQ